MRPARLLPGLALLTPALGTVTPSPKASVAPGHPGPTSLPAPTAPAIPVTTRRPTLGVDPGGIRHRVGLEKLQGQVKTAGPRSASSVPETRAASVPPTGAALAATTFNRHHAARVEQLPFGAVRASREELGFGRHDLAMVDIGGEGEKTTEPSERWQLKSGNLHAINVNDQDTVSKGRFLMRMEPQRKHAELTSSAPIPNRVAIKGSWPGGDVEKAEGLVPFADGFSDITMMEGAPFRPYHAAELGRVTSREGWIFLSVDEGFRKDIEKLAHGHNGGTLWMLDEHDADAMNSRFVLPPASSLQSKEDAAAYRALFTTTSSHELFDVVQAIRLHQLGISQQASLEEVARHEPDVNGEIDFEALLAR